MIPGSGVAQGNLIERQKVLELVGRHGWNSTAFQTLASGYRYFFHGDDACVAYFETRWAWVAAGSPIARPDVLGQVARAFIDAARAAGKRSCFFAVEDRLKESTGHLLNSIVIGEQPNWTPLAWSTMVERHKSLRAQLRRASAKGVSVRLLSSEEVAGGPMRAAMTRAIEWWLDTRRLPPLDFLVRVDLSTFPAHRRCFVAERGGVLVGFANVVPVPARGGWTIENLIRGPGAPNGTTELLVDAVLRWAAEADCRWVTLGLAPLTGDVGRALRIARHVTSGFYDFDGLRAYKGKLHPSAWTAIHLAFPINQSAVLSVGDALAAFAHDGVFRFALRALIRKPAIALEAPAAVVVAVLKKLATAMTT